jgi:hypothetical protein
MERELAELFDYFATLLAAFAYSLPSCPFRCDYKGVVIPKLRRYRGPSCFSLSSGSSSSYLGALSDIISLGSEGAQTMEQRVTLNKGFLVFDGSARREAAWRELNQTAIRASVSDGPRQAALCDCRAKHRRHADRGMRVRAYRQYLPH